MDFFTGGIWIMDSDWVLARSDGLKLKDFHLWVNYSLKHDSEFFNHSC